jgi:lytic murein transglycosylase
MRRSDLICALTAITLGLAGSMAAQAQTNPTPPPPAPANCRNTGSFERWMADFRREAASAGISRATLARALDEVTFDPGIIARDRKQSFFSQSFLSFSDKLISANRLQNGAARLRQHRDLFARVDKEYGVPGPVIAAYWALESDFGGSMGKDSVLRSLATLAYDCRRGDIFRTQLMDALRIVDRGDLVPEEMIGSWAGELGQTQFLPSHYLEHAVDYDGDGKRNLIRSVPDVIASTAHFIVFLGWQRDQPWLQEVRVTRDLSWQEADLAIQHPRSKWAAWGVTLADGKPLPADNLPASLLLPMGRFGPAFLAYPNFQVYLKWNQSLNYSLTAAYLATRLEGAPAMHRGRGHIPEFSYQQVRDLQQILIRRGYLTGEVDGKLGAATRAGVKAAQLKLGLPADSYPTPELLQRLHEQG